MKDKPRRFVKMFKPRFAELIRSGAKRQTIRPTPKRMPEFGDIIDCRQWSGLPYRSKQIRLGEFEVSGVGTVFLSERACEYHLDGRIFIGLKHAPMARDLAQADGFDSFDDMLQWFIENHGLPFGGILIKWRDL